MSEMTELDQQAVEGIMAVVRAAIAAGATPSVLVNALLFHVGAFISLVPADRRDEVVDNVTSSVRTAIEMNILINADERDGGRA